MAGRNLAGVPNTNDYLIGRGKVFFSALDPTTERPIAYRDLGNCTAFNLSATKETQRHFSSQQGIRVSDAEVVLSQEFGVSITIDELNYENLAMWFSGDADAYTDADQVISSGISDPGIAALLVEKKGRWYPLYYVAPGSSAGTHAKRIYGVQVLKINGQDIGDLDDVIVDHQAGMVFVGLNSSLSAGTAEAPQAYTVTYGAWGVNPGLPLPIHQVRGFTKSAITGAVKMISINPRANGHKHEIEIHKVTLSPEGDLALIGDEFATLTLTGTIEGSTAASPDSPYITFRTHKNWHDNPPAFP